MKDYTDRIIVGESDSGGYYPFSIDAVLEKTGIKALEGKYGIRVVNLTDLPRKRIEFLCAGRTIRVPVPAMLLEEKNLFITIAVPKVHMYTGVSLAAKNQWGCIAETSIRMKLHPDLQEVLYIVNQSIGPSLAVIDGKYGLNRTGPQRGDASQSTADESRGLYSIMLLVEK